MGFELGALLGYIGNGAQSFETLNSWDQSSAIGSITLTSTDTNVHSSLLGGVIDTRQSGTFYYKYNYTASNDVLSKFWSEVTTHRVVSYFWYAHSCSTLTDSSVTITIGSNQQDLTRQVNLTRFRIETDLVYNATYQFEIKLSPATADSGQIFLDDILTAVDVIELLPEWDLQLQDQIFRAQNQTLGGANPSYKWGFNKKWEIPLTHVQENEARLINQWWQDTSPLMFTFNTSDTNQQFIVTLTNDQTPMTNLSKAYHDEWQGNLQLSAFNTSLVF